MKTFLWPEMALVLNETVGRRGESLQRPNIATIGDWASAGSPAAVYCFPAACASRAHSADIMAFCT